ncbi:hypothetical protein BVRB_019780, partial [Beta vulgaris subsp. vulgaris]
TVGQGHRHFPTVRTGNFRTFADGILGKWRVPEVTLEIRDLGIGNHLRLDIVRPKFDAGAEIGVHRALAVFGDEDHRACGRRYRSLAPKAGNAGGRIAGAAARGFEGWPHAGIEKLGAVRINQVHGTLDDAVVNQKSVVATRDNVHDGIANRQNVECRHQEPPGMLPQSVSGHSGFPEVWKEKAKYASNSPMFPRSQEGRAAVSYRAAKAALGGMGLITSINTPLGSTVMKWRWPKSSSQSAFRIGRPAAINSV